MRRSRVLPWLLLGAAGAVPFTVYENARFAYDLRIPETMMALPNDALGDGQAWMSMDGQVQVKTWGSHGPSAMNRPGAAQWAEWYRAQDIQTGRRVTYSRVTDAVFVQSGVELDGRLYFRKVLVHHGDEAGLLINYPASHRAVWDALSGRMAGSLRWSAP